SVRRGVRQCVGSVCVIGGRPYGQIMAERTKVTAPASRPVPMKLFATWEVDRTPPNCIPSNDDDEERERGSKHVRAANQIQMS
ncbi:hypothetical protein G9C98_004220, partial [Cotesia typhae]